MNSIVLGLSLGAGFALIVLPLTVLVRSWLGAQPSPTETRDLDVDDSVISQDEAREILLRLHRVADNVGRDVDAHAVEMETISQELVENEKPTKAIVLDAVEQVVRANEKMKCQLDEAKATIDAQAEMIGTQMADALTDALTGIANRRAFDHEFERRIAEYRRKRRPFSLVLCDIDKFKHFNDTYGHVAGDAVLREVASRVASSVRDMDLAARYGGEEFGIVLPETRVQDAKIVAERIRLAIGDTSFVVDGQALQIAVSVGLTQSYSIDEDAQSIVKRADEALYASKQAGRNRGYFHDGEQVLPLTSGESPVRPMESSDRVPGEGLAPASPSDSCPSPPGETSTPRIDEATGLPTRDAFRQELTRQMTPPCRSGNALSVLLLEVDRYENVIGTNRDWELVIAKAVCQIFTAAVAATSSIARLADSQFVALLCDADGDDAMGTACRLRRAIARCDSLGDTAAPIHITASVGTTDVAVGENVDEVFARLERTIRAARNAGGNCVFAHHDGKMTRVQELAPSDEALPVS